MSKTDKALADLAQARNNAALGAEFAPEYVMLKGVRIFYQTFSHAWVIPAVVSRNAKASVFEKGMLTVYVLAQPPEMVRNEIMQQLDAGNIIGAAMDFFAKNQITPDDLESLDVDKLMQQPYAKN